MKKLIILFLVVWSIGLAQEGDVVTDVTEETTKEVTTDIAQEDSLKEQNSDDVVLDAQEDSTNEQAIDNQEEDIVDVQEDSTTNQPQNYLSLDDNNISKDSNQTDKNITNESIVLDTNTTQKDTNTSKVKEYSKFEKQYINHIAFNNYKKAVKLLYDGDYKQAYKLVMKAKEYYDENDRNKVPLPYISGYLREQAFTPRRIYYKMLVDREYELTRLIRKIKLLSPPIAMVVIKRTSTYIQIDIQNIGDLPLDKFEIYLNDEKVVAFDKINPDETKQYIYKEAPVLDTISFKEAYGFAPDSISMGE
jgi:hypothetical protein